ncbi:response regulator transcription factor [Nocardioides piscis]|uniref:Response regulator transcription factor n=1 Tax=Nocardioides piscis TaxID=2714938 RepID=A0A6G7YG58_9ACTN|nr:response regulator transcription factor [Nocardioides piscis]QIK75802.1 response regulator transcription factor [Nocardioides piscis]
MSTRLLLVEDDNGIAVPLIRTLERDGYAVERAATGADAVERVRRDDLEPPAIVLLDLGLPDMDGLDVCQRMRESGYAGGVMIVTARGGELDRVLGLDVGADDYLIKPFLLSELLARVRALLRRTHAAAAVEESAGASAESAPAPFRIDRDRRQVWVGADEVPLNTKEFDLLAGLQDGEGGVVKREQLMAEVWDENWFGSTKVLDVTMARLRQKLEAHHAPVHVVTLRGVGFRLEQGRADA